MPSPMGAYGHRSSKPTILFGTAPVAQTDHGSVLNVVRPASGNTMMTVCSVAKVLAS